MRDAPAPARRAVPGLLPWQGLLLACACGAWAVQDPASGALALLATAACFRLAGRALPGPGLMLLAALAGLAYAWLRLPAPPDLPDWIDRRPHGVLLARVEAVSDRPGNRLEILLDGVSFRFDSARPLPPGVRSASDSQTVPGAAVGPTQAGEPLPGRMVWTWQDPAFRPVPGSMVRLAARPHAVDGFDNPGVQDWAWRWRVRGVFLRVFTQGGKAVELVRQADPSALEAWRGRLREAILRGAGGDSAGGMVLGLVTGDRSGVDPSDLDRVRRASLAHLLAVSGMNLAAVAAMGWALAWLAGAAWPGLLLRVPRPRLAVLLGAPLVAGYLWLGRFEPSLVRAALMFGAWGWLLLLGRTGVLLDGLFFALAVMFALDPLCVFDVGLQLSAAAVAGLVLLAPLALPVADALRGGGAWRLAALVLPGWIAVTLAAQLAVLPIQASVFGEAGAHLYLNLLWTPVVEWAAQPLAYLGALCATWWPAMGDALLRASAGLCALLFESLRFMDARGWLAVHPVYRPWSPEALGYWLLLGGLAYARRMGARRAVAWCALCLCLLGGPWLWRAWEQSRDAVSLTMLDVGQGQALVVEARGGRRWLVDAGGTASPSFDPGRAVLSPALTWGRFPALEGIALSHPDKDHTAGAAYLLSNYRVGFLAGNGFWPGSSDFARAVAQSGLEPRAWRAGERIVLAEGLELEVLGPPAGTALTGNDASLVLRLVWRGRGLALLPGDAGSAVLEGLAASGRDLSAEVLVVAHHGSRSALAPGFYGAAGAKWGLISCGRGNAFGFPAAEVSRALGEAGMRVLETAREGAVTARWASAEAPAIVRGVRGR
ncbi:ComE operon protein 3 [Fundidesulfovibrio magnetotacticus]|uniref:ComE operon protein 3 n=1 Tax=Fundidesulfovibrio magnetotacticus TaxID=2730080 RepID=A0A6V8LW57_9BACT|nr:ComEC/Rec2 family competence protein [Fundidesulfovibrio magnetotacticus]GFK94046.1 ComE operon protein 3 [Fundidesulfovibrio magnetotacticus]